MSDQIRLTTDAAQREHDKTFVVKGYDRKAIYSGDMSDSRSDPREIVIAEVIGFQAAIDLAMAIRSEMDIDPLVT